MAKNKARHSRTTAASKAPLAVREQLDLSRHLPFRLSQVARMLSIGASRSFQKQFDVGVREWRVIATLGDQGSTSAADMVGPAAFDKATVSRAISALERQGFVERLPDQSDGRKHVIRLTDEGIALHDRMVPFARMRAKVFEAAFTPRERIQFFTLLDKLRTQIDWLESEESIDQSEYE